MGYRMIKPILSFLMFCDKKNPRSLKKKERKKIEDVKMSGKFLHLDFFLLS